MKKAVLLVGHGSLREEANSALFALQGLVAKKKPGTLVMSGFLQFAKPTLPEAIAQLAAEGVDAITVVPVFLYEGTHIKEDIPDVLLQEADKYPNMRIVLAPVLGIDERMADIIWDRVQAAPCG